MSRLTDSCSGRQANHCAANPIAIRKCRARQERRAPCPAAHYARRDEPRFHAPTRRGKLLSLSRRVAGVPILEVRDADHQQSEEGTNANDDAVADAWREDLDAGS